MSSGSIFAQRERMAGELEIPAGERRAGTRGTSVCPRSERCAGRAREQSRRVATRGGQRAATSWSRVRAAERGRALDKFQALRREHAHQRPLLHVCETLNRGAIDGHVLRRARLESDRELVATALGGESHGHAGSRRPEAHQLAFCACAWGVAGAAEVETSSRFDLPAPLAP